MSSQKGISVAPRHRSLTLIMYNPINRRPVFFCGTPAEINAIKIVINRPRKFWIILIFCMVSVVHYNFAIAPTFTSDIFITQACFLNIHSNTSINVILPTFAGAVPANAPPMRSVAAKSISNRTAKPNDAEASTPTP